MGGNAPSRQPAGTLRRRKKARKKGRVPDLAGPFAEYQSLLLDDVGEDMAELGAGSYAVVKKITRRGETFAAKQLHANLFNFASQEEQETMLAQFAKECRLLQRAAHPNVVKFIGLHIHANETLPYLVMEFMHATLSGHLDENGKPIAPTDLSILSDVALGLQFLHKHIPSIIHRDLSANNVLLSSKMQAKISDLGMAKIINHGGLQKAKLTQTKAPGTPCYMPPEALQDNPHYDTSIDTFSFGVLTIHVLSGQWPIPVHGNVVNPKDPDKLIALTEFECRMQYVKEVGSSHPLMPLVKRCLHNNPVHRPTAPDIAETVMEVMADETKPKIHVATENYFARKPYELNCQVGEKFLVYDDDTLIEGSLQKVASRRSRQVGYLPKKTIHLLDDLYVAKKAYMGRRKEELTVAKKEFLSVQEKRENWYYMLLISSGRKGMVPDTHVLKFRPMEESE